MSTRSNVRRALVLGATLGLLSIGYWVGVVRAGGAPTMPPLTYSGTILGSTGAPATDGMYTFQLRLYDDPTATGASHMMCDGGAQLVPTHGGHFRYAFPTSGAASCVPAISAHQDLWVDITLTPPGGTATTLPLPRPHLGAVPYAIEADHSVLTDRHVVSGAGGSISTGGVFIGATTHTSAGGALHYYSGARAFCQTDFPSSPTVHMCTMDEVLHSAELGLLSQNGTNAYWFASGSSPATGQQPDCEEFTTSSYSAWAWYDMNPGVHYGIESTSCATALAVLCCD
jgi:hypothetical protein